MFNKIKILSFATEKYILSQNKLIDHLNRIGLKNQINLTDKNLDKNFVKEYESFFMEKRGYGYWIWKPFLMLQEIKNLNDDEILLYIDSSDLPNISFFNFVIKHFQTEKILLINRGYINENWTKRDCFIYMNCDTEECHKMTHIECGVIAVKNNELCVELLTDWFHFMKNKQILDDSPNLLGLPNLPNFKEHRHDQSILTNLSFLKKINSVNVSNDMILFNHL